MPTNMFTLQELAQEMHVTPKTLNRWLEIAQIQPVNAPHDRRKWLVSQDQVQQIKDLFGAPSSPASPAVSTAEPQIRELREQIGALQAELAQLHAWVASVAENVTSLTQRSLASEQQELVANTGRRATQVRQRAATPTPA